MAVVIDLKLFNQTTQITHIQKERGCEFVDETIDPDQPNYTLDFEDNLRLTLSENFFGKEKK